MSKPQVRHTRLYVPLSDTQTNEWLNLQSDRSLSIRYLIALAIAMWGMDDIFAKGMFPTLNLEALRQAAGPVLSVDKSVENVSEVVDTSPAVDIDSDSQATLSKDVKDVSVEDEEESEDKNDPNAARNQLRMMMGV